MLKVIVTSKEELEGLIHSSVKQALKEENAQSGNEEKDQIFSIEEAASFLKLARQTIYGFTSKNLIPFLKRGKKLYFRKSELESWLQEGKQKTVAEIKDEIDGSK